MSIDKARIQGFGSDGQKDKIWHCPAGHHLQPRKATLGRCDLCKRCVPAGEPVMDCKECNWYLCNECHPQEQEEQDWFWGSLNFLIETAQQEMAEIKEEFKEMAGDVESFVSGMSFSGTCGAPELAPKPEEATADSSRRRRNDAGRRSKLGADEGSRRSRSSSCEDPEVIQSLSAFKPATNLARPGAQAAVEVVTCQGSGAAAATAIPGPVDAGDAACADGCRGTATAEDDGGRRRAPVMEDLLDIGQNDLLDLDAEPLRPSGKAAAPDDLLGLRGARSDAHNAPLLDFAPSLAGNASTLA
mmetsp:Transcript_122679/g.354620  ORF Transcript_122679/g.354620 Transcript_122679/m.354620 type:complete len:301 (+) Transcript_122679:56-958(+)